MSKTPESSDKIPLHKVLEEELDYLDLFTKNPPQEKNASKELSEIYKRIHEQARNRSALCLSGGGIRSATFALGVIQGLASHCLLKKFDYLSTVSGGGYIGSWLTAWIHRHKEGLTGVAKELNSTNKSNDDHEPKPVKNLRSYSNYLTPKLGIMSADIWTLAAIYLRNLFLNWLVFIPLLLAALIIPRICVAVILSQPPNWLIYSFLIVGSIAVVITIYYIGVNCPSSAENKGQIPFLLLCLLPLIISAILLTTYWAWYYKDNKLHLWHFIIFGLSLHFISWLLYSAILKHFNIWEFLVVLLTGAAGGGFAWLMATYLFPDINLFAGHYVCFAAPSFLGLFLVAGVLLVGFLGRYFEDKDLEWLARFGAWVLIAITIWSAGSSLVIFGPVGLLTLWEKAPTLIASVGGISGIITLFFSFSSKTSFGKKQNESNGLISILMNNVLIISASIFIVFLVALLSLGTDSIVKCFNDNIFTKSPLTKIIDSSNFRVGEFKTPMSIEKLCNSLNNDLKYSSIGLKPNSIEELNELLKVPDFCDIMQRIKPNSSFSDEIKALIDKTQKYYKKYPYLNKDSNLRRLNRLLLEEVYPQETPKSRNPYSHMGLISNTPFRTVGVLFSGLVIIVVWMSRYVDINKFSLHSLYRNRLIRAYLGASNPKRKPNLFTGFDENDDLKMYELCSPDFRKDEFESQSSVVELCIKINKMNIKFSRRTDWLSNPINIAINLSDYLRYVRINFIHNFFSRLSEKPYSIEWLNECLRMPNLYAEYLSKINSISKNSPIQKLLEKTKKYRTNKQFNDLNNIQQYNIKLLNRLLLEKVYPETPNTRIENKPLHVVNITLNLVKGKKLAWQERKAASFSITPLHSGSSGMHFDPDTTDNQPNSSNSNKSIKGCYRSSEAYGGDDKGRGISLGTAITVSGAAASPNMGYHSSSVLAFLMTLFNIRLGLWLDNPANDKTYKTQRPTSAVFPIIREAFGLTDEQYKYVYLSDGGHFENLGLYEMIVRRCHYIVVVDAGCDDIEGYKFADLGNAIRKIRIDLGVPIEFNNIPIYPPNDQKKDGKYCAVGTIKYTAVDEGGKDGKLLYIKPTLCRNEPVDILNYAKTNTKFPHEPTSDQWFSESQFESYRALGFHAINQIVGKVKNKKDRQFKDMPSFFKQVENYSPRLKDQKRSSSQKRLKTLKR